MSTSGLRPRRKPEPVEIANTEIRDHLSTVTNLDGATDVIRSVIFVEEQNALLPASHDGNVRIYDLNSSGHPRAVFSNHNNWVNELAQLDNDLVVSVSDDKDLFTWRVSDNQLIGEWNHDQPLTAVAKLNSSRIVVGDEKGGVTFLSHKNGASFYFEKQLKRIHSDWIRRITVHGSKFATCSDDKKAVIWDEPSRQPLATLKHNEKVLCVAINDHYIITASGDNRLQVFENGQHFTLCHVFRIPQFALDVQFITNDVCAVADSRGFFNFISLSYFAFISRFQLSHYSLNSFVVLPDARIAVVGQDKFCSCFSPPSQVRDVVHNCAAHLYPTSAINVQHSYPLCAAWDAVQSGTLSLNGACTEVITSTNCKRSLDEWCFAHNLLMQAVKSGDVPPTSHFNGTDFHWHQVLYQHCAELAIGEKDINFLLSLFMQAEKASVIAKGGAEVLINIINVRQDIVSDTRLITRAIYKLFMRQAEMDVRLREVLQYRRVQQLTAIINAVLNCIPIGEAIATNVVRGGVSILRDFQICGFVESIMSTSKDIGALENDHLVNRFVRRSTQVLSAEGRSKLSLVQRIRVRWAARSLGLSVEQLRIRLDSVMRM